MNSRSSIYDVPFCHLYDPLIRKSSSSDDVINKKYRVLLPDQQHQSHITEEDDRSVIETVWKNVSFYPLEVNKMKFSFTMFYFDS